MSDEILPPEPRRSVITNPFGGGVSARPAGALAQAEQQKVVAEVQARIMIARSFPRDPIKAMDLILIDCTRPTLAKKALYEYARGGTAISGPSIRLAEAIAQRWGNIASGVKEISRANGYSECVAYAFDMESGFYDERQFQVRHWRDTNKGGYVLTDERDIYEAVANNGARRKRAAMLTVIPGDVVEAAVEQCEETLAATADTSPDALLRMVEAFEQFQVTREQIEKRIQRRIEAIRPAQVIQLSKIFASLVDGMSGAADWFETEAASGGIWGDVDRQHAEQTQQAGTQTTTRRAPRKAAAKEAAAASPPAEGTAAQQGGTMRQPPAQTQAAGSGPNPPAADTNGTQREVGSPAVSEAGGDAPNAPPADPARTSASAGTVPDAGAALGTSAPAGQTQTNSAGAEFSAYLIDGDGVAIDGTDEFTDPLGFAVAYAAAYTDMFPPERKPFERANAENLAMARAMNPEAVDAALAPPKPVEPPPSAQAAAPELPLNAPHDEMVIPKPPKPTRASFIAFNDTLKRMVKTANNQQLTHIGTVNAETINGMPNAFRLEAVGIIEARRKEIAAPPTPAQTNGAASVSLVEDLIHDVYSLVSPESVSTWVNMPRIAAHLKAIQASDRPGWIRVMSAANAAYVRMRVGACGTVSACNALETDQMVDGALGWLHENDGKEHDAVVAFAKDHRASLAA